MRSTSALLWVIGTTPAGVQHRASVAMRTGETVEEAMERGCSYILNTTPGVMRLTNVRAETIDYYEFNRTEALMDGQIPGGFLEQGGPR